MYGFHQTVARRMYKHMAHGKGMERIMPFVIMAAVFLPLAALGAEIRERLKYDLWGMKVPKSATKDGFEYVHELVSRAGIYGLGQVAFDLKTSNDRGNSFLIGLLGPSISQLDDLIGVNTWTLNQFMRQIPGLSQMTGARHAISD